MDNSTTAIDDRQLVLRIMEKDEDVLRQLVQVHGVPVMQSLSARFSGLLDGSEIESILNAAAFKVWNSAGNYDPDKGPFRNWFYRIAEREVFNCLRENRVDCETLLLEFEPSVSARRCDDTSQSEAAAVRELLELISSLPKLQQAIILADLAAGDTADDERLARLHDSTVNSIRASRSVARRRLRDEMQRRGHGGQTE